MRILLIEDDVKTAEYVRQGLTDCGYIVDCVHGGPDGLFLARHHDYELIVLDINLPGMDGWQVLDALRRRHCASRIMLLTARSRLADKVRGLENGADDYLIKPFEFPELLARVRALMRRADSPVSIEVIRVADLELDQSRHRAFRDSQRIDLTTKEFALLHYLMRNTGVVLSRTQIISQVWDMNFDCDTNVVEVSIRRLRAKIDDPFASKLIHTLRGVGYVLERR
ncbi:Transcriptional activator protein CzcR [compost metagenome]